MNFCEERDIGFCGLACVLCSSADCPGCKKRGCDQASDCSVLKCATEKGVDACYDCKEYPCGENMLKGTRIKAFNQYARQFKKAGLLNRLKSNHLSGITYHTPDGTTGDYDTLTTEKEIFDLIKFGKGHNPYINCPTFETDNFIIRLIKEEDANDLCECYSDPKTQEIVNADNCSSDFKISSPEEMRDYIIGWLTTDIADHFYIRFSIVDKQNQKAIGTIEMFDWSYQKIEGLTGILRIDLASAYENELSLKELIDVSYINFAKLFNTDCIVTKAVETAQERINALTACGFVKYDNFLDGERVDYFIKRKIDA